MPACLNALGFYIYYSYNISLRFIVTAGRGHREGGALGARAYPPPPFAIACRRGFAPIVHGACAVWHLPCTRMRTCYMMCQTTHAPIPNCGILLDTHSTCSHFLSDHSELTVTTQEITDACICCSDSIFIFGRSLHNTVKPFCSGHYGPWKKWPL